MPWIICGWASGPAWHWTVRACILEPTPRHERLTLISVPAQRRCPPWRVRRMACCGDIPCHAAHRSYWVWRWPVKCRPIRVCGLASVFNSGVRLRARSGLRWSPSREDPCRGPVQRRCRCERTDISMDCCRWRFGARDMRSAVRPHRASMVFQAGNSRLHSGSKILGADRGTA